ncbi:MAG: PTS sugar transporter subunit IIC [Deltaproteobacteria bacterium]|nr:PTS sugar transporter subunit IIC [Deltaproteobacteria bacterium]
MGLLVLAAVAGLAAVERRGFLQAMLSRPVILGPLCGLALGDLGAGLLLGAVLELLFLGAVSLGASMALHETVATAAIAGGAALAGQRLGGQQVAVAALAVAVGLPLAIAGRLAEAAFDKGNQRLDERARRLLLAGDARGAMRCNLLGLAAPFALSALLAPLGAAAIGAAATLLLTAVPRLARPLELAFAAFAALACAAAARSLRTARAPFFFFGSAGTLLVILALGRLHR